MAKSRIETFKDYRNSIISDSEPVLRTQIETSLETTSTESKTAPTVVEAVFLKKMLRKKYFLLTLFWVFIVAVVVLEVVFGLILFN